MACQFCNDATASESGLRRTDEVALFDLEHGAQGCKYCEILLAVVESIGAATVSTIRVQDDMANEPSKGVALYISYLSHDTTSKSYAEFNVQNVVGKLVFSESFTQIHRD